MSEGNNRKVHLPDFKAKVGLEALRGVNAEIEFVPPREDQPAHYYSQARIWMEMRVLFKLLPRWIREDDTVAVGFRDTSGESLNCPLPKVLSHATRPI